jgi:alanine dehydrogenase
LPLLLTRADIQQILDRGGSKFRETLIGKVDAGYREIAAAQVEQHRRIYLRPKGDALRRPKGLFSMSALLPGAQRMGTRLVALGGPGRGTDGDGLLVLFDHQSLRCLAIMNDQGPLHSHRTGAPSGLATRLLARENARSIAVIGSSGIARGALVLANHVRTRVDAIRVFSPTRENRERFAAGLATALGKDVRAVSSPEDAVCGADIVITATDADRPVIPDSAIAPGTHINVLARNELEMATFKRARLVVSSRQTAGAHDPPWRDPLPDDWVDAELADVVTGARAGRTSPDEVTVFVGSAAMAMWDVAAAGAFYDAGAALGLGKELSLEE